MKINRIPVVCVNKQHMKRLLFLIYSLCFLFLGVLAAYFYEERIYGSDASSYLFGVINTEWFYTERGRIIIWLSQWFPLIAVLSGLTIKQVLIAHSIGHVLFYYILFLLGYLYFRNPLSGISLLLIQTLGVTFSYFAWPYGEIQYGVAVLLLLVWVIDNHVSNPKLTEIVLGSVLISFIIGSHPLIWPLLGYSLVSRLISNETRNRAAYFFCASATLFLLKLVVFPSYDGGLAVDVPTKLQFLRENLHGYWGMIQANAMTFGLLLGCWVFFILERQYGRLTLSVLSTAIIVIAIALYGPIEEATQQYYLSFTGLGVLALNDLFGRRNNTQLRQLFVIGLASLMFLLSIPPIIRLGQLQKGRTKHIHSFINICIQRNAYRGIVKGFNYYKENIAWFQPDIFFEVLLLSSQQQTPIRYSLYELAMNQLNILRENGETLGPDSPKRKILNYEYTAANARHLKQHISEVQPEILNKRLLPIKEEEPVTFLNSDGWNEFAGNEVDLSGCMIKEGPNNVYLVSVTIENNTNEPIFSGTVDNIALRLRDRYSKTNEADDVPLTADLIVQMQESFQIASVKQITLPRVQLIHQGSVVADEPCAFVPSEW